MARLADDYKDWDLLIEVTIDKSHLTEKELKVFPNGIEIWRYAKPKEQLLLTRIHDAWKVFIGEFDAVYYHPEKVTNKTKG